MKINHKYLKSLLISAALVSSLTACSDWFQGKLKWKWKKKQEALLPFLLPKKK